MHGGNRWPRYVVGRGLDREVHIRPGYNKSKFIFQLVHRGESGGQVGWEARRTLQDDKDPLKRSELLSDRRAKKLRGAWMNLRDDEAVSK